MKILMAWLYAVISLLLGFIPFIIGFIVYPIVLGFNAGYQACEILGEKSDAISKKMREKIGK